jgi:hypothetical protein
MSPVTVSSSVVTTTDVSRDVSDAIMLIIVEIILMKDQDVIPIELVTKKLISNAKMGNAFYVIGNVITITIVLIKVMKHLKSVVVLHAKMDFSDAIIPGAYTSSTNVTVKMIVKTIVMKI